MSKIAFFSEDRRWGGYFKKKLEGDESLEVDFFEGDYSSQKGDFSNYEIISTIERAPVDSKALDKFPNLKFIAAGSTGFDHIDLDLCKERGIKVSNVPSYGENTVAEFTFALILNLSRKLYDAISVTKKGDSN